MSQEDTKAAAALSAPEGDMARALAALSAAWGASPGNIGALLDKDGVDWAPEVKALQDAAEVVCTTTPPPGDGWRPIAEAPKDGTLFLCWVSAERWSHEDGGGSGRSADTSEVDFGQWRHFDSGGAYVNMMGQIGDMQDITHWMPLPAAPSAKEVANG